MIGLIFSYLVLFAATAALGVAAGWRLRALSVGAYMRQAAKDNAALSAALSEAQVRRARGP